MTDYSNWKILKADLNNNLEEYSNVAQWCNENQQYIIIEDGDYYKVSEKTEPSVEILQKRVRDLRNDYLSKYDFTQLPDAPFSEEEKEKYAEYRQYLRDYTNQDEWWLEYPLTYEEWRVFNVSK